MAESTLNAQRRTLNAQSKIRRGGRPTPNAQAAEWWARHVDDASKRMHKAATENLGLLPE